MFCLIFRLKKTTLVIVLFFTTRIHFNTYISFFYITLLPWCPFLFYRCAYKSSEMKWSWWWNTSAGLLRVHQTSKTLQPVDELKKGPFMLQVQVLDYRQIDAGAQADVRLSATSRTGCLVWESVLTLQSQNKLHKADRCLPRKENECEFSGFFKAFIMSRRKRFLVTFPRPDRPARWAWARKREAGRAQSSLGCRPAVRMVLLWLLPLPAPLCTGQALRLQLTKPLDAVRLPGWNRKAQR